jgi:hypothetical protein
VRETENRVGRDGLRRGQRAEGPAQPKARLVGRDSGSPGRRSKSSRPDRLQGRLRGNHELLPSRLPGRRALASRALAHRRSHPLERWQLHCNLLFSLSFARSVIVLENVRWG